MLALSIIALLYAVSIRWPSHHHVKKQNVPSHLYIKANTLKTTSSYRISALFEACCSDALICKDVMRSKGINQTIEFHLDASNRSASIPLDWTDRSFCPYRILNVSIENDARNTLLSISDGTSNIPLPTHYILQKPCNSASNCDYELFRFPLSPPIIEIQ